MLIKLLKNWPVGNNGNKLIIKGINTDTLINLIFRSIYLFILLLILMMIIMMRRDVHIIIYDTRCTVAAIILTSVMGCLTYSM